MDGGSDQEKRTADRRQDLAPQLLPNQKTENRKQKTLVRFGCTHNNLIIITAAALSVQRTSNTAVPANHNLTLDTLSLGASQKPQITQRANHGSGVPGTFPLYR